MTWAVTGLVLSLASAGGQYYNTQRTAKKQDRAAADSILNQSRIQRQADQKVAGQVAELEGSNADAARATRLDDYMDTLRANRGGLRSGLTPSIGSSAFQGDSLAAADAVEAGAGDTAGLMARMDAPGMQRQGEAFGYGNLATDIGLIGRESQGQSFMDNLRMNSIRRNPWIDAGSQLAGGAAGAMAGRGSGAQIGGVTREHIPIPKLTGYGG